MWSVPVNLIGLQANILERMERAPPSSMMFFFMLGVEFSTPHLLKLSIMKLVHGHPVELDGFKDVTRMAQDIN